MLNKQPNTKAILFINDKVYINMGDITNRQQLIHLHSEIVKELSPEQINFGEIAVQYAADEPLLYIKDSDGNIVKFIDSKKIDEYINDIVSAITENEFVISSALVDLDSRVTDISSALTRDEYVISMALNDLNLRIENCADQSDLEELQEIIGGGALDDRYVTIDDFNSFTNEYYSFTSNTNSRITNLSSSTVSLSSSTRSALDALSSAMSKVLTQYATSASVHSTIDWLKNEVIDDELVIAAALNDISERVSANTEALESKITASDLEDYVTSAAVHSSLEYITETITDDEEVTSTAINDLNTRLVSLGGDMQSLFGDLRDEMYNITDDISNNISSFSASTVSSLDEIMGIIIDDEFVTATSLNDLNSRIANCPTFTDLENEIQNAVLEAGNY